MINTEENKQDGINAATSAPSTLIKAVNRGLYDANDGIWTDFRCLWPAYVAQAVLPFLGAVLYEGACIGQVMRRSGTDASTAGSMRLVLLHAVRWLGAVVPLAVLSAGCALLCGRVADMTWGGWMVAGLVLLFLLLMNPIHMLSMALSFGVPGTVGAMRCIVDGLRHFLSLLSFSLLSLLVILPVVAIGSAPFGIICYVWMSHSQAEAMGDLSTLPSYFYLLAAVAWLLAAASMSCAQIVYTWMAHYAWLYFSKQDENITPSEQL